MSSMQTGKRWLTPDDLAALVDEAAERLRWHYDDEGEKSLLLDTSTVRFDAVFEDYLALHTRIEAL